MTIIAKYSDVELRHEIHTLLDDLAARHEPWHPQWIAQAICRAHQAALARDADEVDRAFWEFAGYTLTRKLTTTCINARVVDASDAPAGPPAQLALPGFARVHLQDYYVVQRDDEDIAVSVLDLTDKEIRAKAALYRSQAAQSVAHADELERFMEWRRHP